MPRVHSASSLAAITTLGITVIMLSACTSFWVRLVPLPSDKHLKTVPGSGKFQNEATLVMIAPQTFLFVQPKDAAKRFSFTTHEEEYVQASDRFRVRKRTIMPEDMFTTGSSVPRELWTVKGLGPMDFAKSSIIHDWLFEAHHRWQIAAAQKDEAGMEKYKDYAASGVLNPTTQELTVVDAADIMTEAIKLEMSFNDACVKGLKDVANARTVDMTGENWAKGLDELSESFATCRTSPRLLHQYSWAIRSKPAKKMWDPSTKDNLSSMLTSTVEVVKKLKATGHLDQALKRGIVAPDTYDRLISLVREYDTRKTGLTRAIQEYASTPSANEVSSAHVVVSPLAAEKTSASIGAVNRSGESSLAVATLAQIASAVHGVARQPHDVSRVPSLTEVRFYHYPEDKAEAETILEVLQRRGIKGRVSFVIDKSQPRHAFQIAFAPGALTAAAAH